jgi:hypothetical protein
VVFCSQLWTTEIKIAEYYVTKALITEAKYNMLRNSNARIMI